MNGNAFNQGEIYQFNIENKVSLIPSDFPTEKLLIVLAIVLFVFLAVIVLRYRIYKRR